MLKHVITRDALFQFCFNVSILGKRGEARAPFVFQISLKTVHKNLSYARFFMFGAKKKKKNTKKIRQVSGSRISGTAGAIPFKFGM